MNTLGFKESVDAAEQAMKRHNAFSEGQRAGNALRAAGLNPYPDDSQEFHEWNRGRMATLGANLNGAAA